jgi:hypothetical protein
METLAERIKTLEDKVSILESGSFGALRAKEEPMGKEQKVSRPLR